jgi:hypothetical protein
VVLLGDAAPGVTGNRYTTYAFRAREPGDHGPAASARDKMTWALNWDLWSTVRWSDMGLLEPNGWPLLWNRLLVLSLTLFCTSSRYVSWRGGNRRDADRPPAGAATLARARCACCRLQRCLQRSRSSFGCRCRTVFQGRAAKQRDQITGSRIWRPGKTRRCRRSGISISM